jgi:predicted small integral membrane protein
MHLTIAKIITILGLACYLTVCTFNNIVDKGTNEILLGKMFNMQMLSDDPTLGKGLLPRSIATKNMPIITLKCITVLEILTSSLLWFSGFQLLRAYLFKKIKITKAISSCNLALSSFMGLWFFFWCGGLWFGYWIKTGQIQEVHMHLIMISILALIFVNTPIGSKDISDEN